MADPKKHNFTQGSKQSCIEHTSKLRHLVVAFHTGLIRGGIEQNK